VKRRKEYEKQSKGEKGIKEETDIQINIEKETERT
jgi:hypothetical protein